MTYVALLRGINVGGNNKIEMARLKRLFEELGADDVKTYINSGNVIFNSDVVDHRNLSAKIEFAISRDFGLTIPVVLRDTYQMKKVVDAMPDDWANDESYKTDILFLWEAVDTPDAATQVRIKPDIEALKYVPGALLWRIGRKDITRGSMVKIIGSDFYKHVTIRNANTVRKIYGLMQAAAV